VGPELFHADRRTDEQTGRLGEANSPSSSTSLPGMQWVYIRSLDMPEYEVMRSPISSQGVVLV
jgi:hypothetical protein